MFEKRAKVAFIQFRSSCQEVFRQKGAPKNFAKFTRKHLRASLRKLEAIEASC